MIKRFDRELPNLTMTCGDGFDDVRGGLDQLKEYVQELKAGMRFSGLNKIRALVHEVGGLSVVVSSALSDDDEAIVTDTWELMRPGSKVEIEEG